MKIFLVVVSGMQPFYGADNRVMPVSVREMPSLSACQAVAAAILDMSGRRTQVRCVMGRKDYN